MKSESVEGSQAIVINTHIPIMKWGKMKLKFGTISIFLILMCSGFIGFLNFSDIKVQGTTVSGIISTDTTWDIAGSPYIVTSNLTVASGVELTINPGVEIRFDGYYGIHVDGFINAVGTETNRIKFTSNKTNPSLGDWGSIVLNSTENCRIVHSDLSYGVGINLRTSSYNEITNNNFFKMIGGVGLIWGSNHNKLINNKITHGMGGFTFYFGASWNIIDGNEISSNNGTGMHLEEGASNNLIINNTISDNNGFGIAIDIFIGNNVITRNTISNNSKVGIFLAATWNNHIYHNNIIDNNLSQAYDAEGTNYWSDTYPSGGNYWSNYSSTCIDNFDGAVTPQTTGSSDGICDSPFVIDANSIDYYPLKNPLDLLPPVISDMQPPDTSTIKINKPLIGANFSDSSGIDTTSIVLMIDSVDVTASPETIINQNSVSYTPPTSLPEGVHNVYLSVKDTIGYREMTSWYFTVNTSLPLDTTPPMITNLRPANNSTIDVNLSTIGAEYSDDSGINVSGVILRVDDEDVTLFTLITTNGITYTPKIPLENGEHIIYLKVKDNSSNQNIANKTWSFIVETIEDIPSPPPSSKDFLSDYWLILVMITTLIVELVAIYLIFWRKKKV